MDINISNFIPSHFNDNSRVWIFQNPIRFNDAEAEEIKNILSSFLSQWNAHGAAVKGFATVLYNKFIIIMADEGETIVSGCSSDSLERMIKQIRDKYNVDLFERLSLSFIVDGEIISIMLHEIEKHIENGTLTPDTLYFNNTVLNKIDFVEKWILPASQSWLSKYFVEERKLAK